MENAVDALKMAAEFFVFVLALSISINAFGNLRRTSQAILEYNDREFIFDWVEDTGETERIVGVESIIPTIYKAYSENYKIIFEAGTINGGLYKKDGNGDGIIDDTKNENGIEADWVYEIDLENENLANNTQKKDFIGYLLYGTDYNKNIEEYNINNFKKFYNFETNLGIELKDSGIYGTIKGKKFKEYLGVYYQEEITTGDETEEINNDDVPEANKTKKRVITYKET